MADAINYSLIHYKGLPVALEGEFTFKAGMKPDVNSFTCAYEDFDALKQSKDDPGPLEFLFTRNTTAGAGGAADFKLARIWMVSWEVLERGTLSDFKKVGPQRVRIFLTDERQRFVKPRGGRLHVRGVLNERTSKDKPYKNSELINLCLRSMHLGGTDVPKGVDDIQPPSDLKWLGSHAPTELEDLLDRIGFVLLLKTDGTWLIEQIGDSKAKNELGPKDRRLPTITPGKDRRGKVIVFTSYPNPVRERIKLTGMRDETWEYVMQDPLDGTWKRLDEVSALSNPLSEAKNRFVNSNSTYRELFATYVYHCIRLNVKKYGSRPILRTQTRYKSENGVAHFENIDIRVKAKIVQEVSAGKWQTSKDKVNLPVQQLIDGTILKFGWPLVKLDKDDPDADPLSHITPLEDGDIEVEFERERPDPDDEKKFVYFEIGYRQPDGGGEPQELDPDETSGVLTSGTEDYIIIERPEWILYFQNHEPVNRPLLKSWAKAEAKRFLAGADEPSEIRSAVGFFPIELSGKISEIRISQKDVTTTWHFNTWWLPRDAYLSRIRAKEKAKGAEAHPEQAKTSGDRTAVGGAGYVQPSCLITGGSATLPPPKNKGPKARVGKPRDKEPGMYDGTAVGGDLNGQAVHIFNTMEEDRSKHLMKQGLLLIAIPDGDDTDSSTTPPTVTPRLAVSWDPDVIRKLRIKSETGSTTTYHFQDSHKIDPQEDKDWENWGDGEECSSGGSGGGGSGGGGGDDGGDDDDDVDDDDGGDD